MSRLIDADALIEKLKRTSAFECVRNSADKNVFEIIADQPTAYDPEKVVEQEENFLVNFGVPKDTKVHRKIIDIVKRGGVE